MAVIRRAGMSMACSPDNFIMLSEIAPSLRACSEAISFRSRSARTGLPRRFAPRNDGIGAL
jgi:hypothetical protein